ncbi:WD40-repeat-containing domain protein [Absidia repens]|uniref:WD40-repeat-containing domain protein n=1 Tax=Absidia repens TaxID=90262 RepID=A0A1X2IAH5_9FUNG|nr:WD40-repeat-containing domain protein [Absidia repens]
MSPNLSNRNKSHINNFFKACHWSPDGTCLLTSSEDRMIRLFDIPSSIYDPSTTEPVTLTPSLGILEGESICDIAWFPSMNSQDPATCCFLSSTRDHPVRLWDATTGKVRASYCVVDHQERFIGPNVLKFNLDGTKIYCGYENMIEIFDVHAPGNNTSTKHSTTPHRKSRKGQKGIISCLDFNPDHSGMYAAGSYSQSIGIYDERTNDLCLKLTGMKGGGITQVKFSLDGNLLYSASRQFNRISCWDIRQSGNILYEIDRKGKTNQRITFDLDPTGSVLVTGDQVIKEKLIYL